ncbi:OmpA family protein [Chitinibacter bivalviorum]|uniref:OmpA family protein n=1 Tax=Chitinibacter bivalviorum TaxID=2739434 RepID=A0A7H9BJC2_9NEIS|nr:OmpA family protein [Chitinibacter bivalviorum]QLG88101.1 OmpA family protein [Chitinibacter bivalviorum]
MKKIILPSLLAVSLAMTGCANMSPETQGALIGALGGAAAGAVISKASGGHHTGRDAAIGAAVGAIGGYAWSSHMEKQRQEMEKAAQGTGIEVSKTPNNELKLEVPSDFSFDTGKYTIKPNMRPVLDKLGQTLNQNPVTLVRIVGHTDSTGSDAINEPLSVNRAASVQSYLIGKNVAGNRMSIEGRGSREPVADNSTTAGKAQNRRVEIFVAEPAQPQK